MKKLNMLILENTENNALPIVRELKERGYEIKYTLAMKEEDFRRELQKNPDLIISDFNPPGFGVSEALKVLREYGKDIPYIIVSSSIGEERAGDMMKAGVCDYVNKSRLSRLAPVIERELREHELHKQFEYLDRKHHRLATAVHEAADAITITDAAGVVEYVNPAFEKMSGCTKDEALNRVAGIFMKEADEPGITEEIRGRILGGNAWRGRLKKRKKDNSIINVELSVSPIKNKDGETANFIILEKDITEKLKLENQLRQAQKMEAVGTLAGGIAHDFNNILMVLMTNAEMAAEGAVPGSSLKTYMERILRAGEHARNLVTQILTFSHRQERVLQPVDLGALVREIMKLMRSTLPSTIEIRLKMSSGTGLINADPTEINQIIVNLCTNAFYAMREKGGILSIVLSPVDIDSDASRNTGGLAPGPYLMLKIGDTGTGMSKEIMERIFEPYFTTRNIGEGTGMGLSMVHGIVRELKGEITVDSEPGAGTVFKIYFPKYEGEVQEKEESDFIPRGKGEKIMFVDDEEILVESVSGILKSLGYSVSAYSSSIMALEKFRKKPWDFDLVITDQTMPGFTGAELFSEMQLIRNDIPIILSTGYSDNVTSEDAVKMGISDFLMKPVSKKQLAFSVKNALESARRKISA